MEGPALIAHSLRTERYNIYYGPSLTFITDVPSTLHGFDVDINSE